MMKNFSKRSKQTTIDVRSSIDGVASLWKRFEKFWEKCLNFTDLFNNKYSRDLDQKIETLDREKSARDPGISRSRDSREGTLTRTHDRFSLCSKSIFHYITKWARASWFRKISKKYLTASTRNLSEKVVWAIKHFLKN